MSIIKSNWYIHPEHNSTFVLEFGYECCFEYPIMNIAYKPAPYKHAFIDFSKQTGCWMMKRFFYVHIEYDVDRKCKGSIVDKTINCRNLEHRNKVLEYWRNVKDRNVYRVEYETSYVAELDNGVCFGLNNTITLNQLKMKFA